jgi:DNA-binding FadR family transcriptional regulator
MAQSHQTGNSIVTADNRIRELISAPVSPDWTVDCLAEEVLCAIAARGSEEAQEFMLDAEAITDRQSRRILRPLLACLANKSAAETGSSPDLYAGRLLFRRPSPDGPVWILGRFENSPATVRVILRRSSSPPQHSEPSAFELSPVAVKQEQETSSPTGKELMEYQRLFSRRYNMELDALEVCARDPDAWKVLEKANGKLEKLLDRTDPESDREFLSADIAFHQEIVRVAVRATGFGQGSLDDLAKMYGEINRRANLMQMPSDKPRRPEVYAEHRAIVDALKDDRPEEAAYRAGKALLDHLYNPQNRRRSGLVMSWREDEGVRLRMRLKLLEEPPESSAEAREKSVGSAPRS